MSQQYVICEDADHAAAVDAIIFAELQANEGAFGNQWSGVYTDGTRYGVLWGAPASDLFGFPPSPEHPDGDPSLVLVDADATWAPYVPPADPEAPAS